MLENYQLSRRGLLGLMLATATAPAIVRASSLMPLYVPQQKELLVARMANCGVRMSAPSRADIRLGAAFMGKDGLHHYAFPARLIEIVEAIERQNPQLILPFHRS